MKKSDAIKHYGSRAAIGRALRIGKAAVSKWPEKVPRPWAAELHIITNGALHFDPSEYVETEEQEKVASSNRRRGAAAH